MLQSDLLITYSRSAQTCGEPTSTKYRSLVDHPYGTSIGVL